MENDVIELLDSSDFSSCKSIIFVLSTWKIWLPELGVGVVENKADAEGTVEEHGVVDDKADVDEHGVVETHDVVDIEYDDAIGAIEVSASWDL